MTVKTDLYPSQSNEKERERGNRYSEFVRFFNSIMLHYKKKLDLSKSPFRTIGYLEFLSTSAKYPILSVFKFLSSRQFSCQQNIERESQELVIRNPMLTTVRYKTVLTQHAQQL